MTLNEKIKMAEGELAQAERMIEFERKSVKEWEDKAEQRRDYLIRLKADVPSKNKSQEKSHGPRI